MAGNLAIGETRTESGGVTSPGAGALIASLAAPPAGFYALTVGVVCSGPVGVAERNNMRLHINGVAQPALLVLAVAPTALRPPPGPHTFAMHLNGLAPVEVRAIGAGTVGAVYSASIMATPINRAG